MKKALRLVLALFVVLLVGLAAVPVLAVVLPPPPPTASSHLFHGTVTVGGSPAIDGTLVSAHIGISLAWSTTTKSGEYGADPIFALPADNTGTTEIDGGVNGDEITFKVSGVAVNSYVFEEGAATELNLSIAEIPTQLAGVTCEVNCEILPGVSVQLYEAGGAPIGDPVTSDAVDGSYVLPVPAEGSYDVMASKIGFRDETQEAVDIVAGVNNLDFRGDTGIIPNAPEVFYVLECVNHWLYPEVPCGLSVFKVLEVVNAWLYPVT
jgi:hypothetical protein